MKKRLLLFFALMALLQLLALYIIIKPKFQIKRQSVTIKPETKTDMPLRKPAVAGSFYPDKFEELAGQIDSFLQKTSVIPSEGKLRILIAPHAGVVFSGQTAAWGFKQIEEKDYKNIILLGPSHRAIFNNAIVYDKGLWETPFGKTEIDEELVKKFLSLNSIESDRENFKEEHSLEMELIFLQRVLKDFRIVPILLGQTSQNTLEVLAEKISDNLDEETLLVVSSDLSHYPDWENANKVDNKTINAILSANPDSFEKTLTDLSGQHYQNLETCACGQEAIKVALMVAEKQKITDFQKIFYENSGDVSGDRSRVVGYTAIGAWSKEKGEGTNHLDEKSKKEILEIARKTLQEYLFNGEIPQIIPKNTSLNEKLGAFVTLKNQGQLRGCIGLFEPDFPLYSVVQKMAIAAATQDSRFSPVTKNELAQIKIEVSVMTPKKKLDDWRKIKLGNQGVVIKKGFQSGTFLPQVASETGWSLEEFLGQLCSQKAGLPSECYKDPGVEIYTFEARVFSEE